MSSCFRMFSAKIKMTKLLVSGKCKAASASLHEGASKRGRTIPLIGRGLWLILVVLLLYVLIPSPTILQSDWNRLKYQQHFKPLVEGIWAIRTRETLQVYWVILGLFMLAINVVCGSWYFFILFCFYTFFVFLCFCVFFASLHYMFDLYCFALFWCLLLLAFLCCFSTAATTATKTTEAPTAKRTNKNNNKKNKNNSPCPPAVSTLLLPTPMFWPFFLRLGVNTMGPRKS